MAIRLQRPASLVVGLALLLSAGGAYAQGTFQNLDFESATIVPDPSSPFYPNAVIASSALPGWTAYIYGFPETSILYHTRVLSTANVTLFDPNDVGDPTPLEGLYSVGLMGQVPGTSPSQSAAIAQTGQVPDAARALTFFAQIGGLQITFNGQLIPYTGIGSGPNYTIWGCDVSAFAGQTGELRFTTLPNTSALIDNIQFSDQSVPEPGVFGVSALGALLVGWRFLWRRRCQRN